MHIKTAMLNGVASLEIARPEKKNAIGSEMYAQMAQALDVAGQAQAVRAVLIHGQPDVFTSGNDLEDFVQGEPMAPGSPLRAFMQALADCPKPVVAAVTGPAIGVGTTMLLHCDLVYASDTARFALPFVSLGLVPEFGASWLLPRLAGRAKASEKLLLGMPFTADEAADMGLVNDILPEPEVIAHARRVAERFSVLPPAAVQQTKRLMNAGLGECLSQAMAAEIAAFSECVKGPEAKEALSAFFQKRPPDFSKF